MMRRNFIRDAWSYNYGNSYSNNNYRIRDGNILQDPVTSYGILAFSYDYTLNYNSRTCDSLNVDHPVRSVVNDSSVFDPLRLLVIERRNTMGYTDFIRGRYFNNNTDFILDTYLNEMTIDEKLKIKNFTFNELWDDLWCNHNCIQFRRDRKEAGQKFSHLNIEELLKRSTSNYTNTEIGFPKGRKMNNETTKMCAIREFAEETGYSYTDYTLLDVSPLVENFKGTNNIYYRHVYYIAILKSNINKPCVDDLDLVQYQEVRNVDLLKYEHVNKLMRDYDVEKKKILYNAFCIGSNVINGINITPCK